MLRRLFSWLLPIAFAAAMLLALGLFQSRPPRDPQAPAALEALVREARKAYPNTSVEAIDARAASPYYEVWIRYFAAPAGWRLGNPLRADTVFVLTTLSARAAPPGVFWMREQAPFRAYLSAP